MTGVPPVSGDWLSLERFDFSAVGRHWAVLRLLARLQAELEAPLAGLAGGRPQLIIDRGDPSTRSLYPARACRFERRLVAVPPRDPRAGSELLWRAAFAVPLTIIEAPESVFALTAGGSLALALPAPRARLVTRRPLSLATRARPATSRITVGHARQRVAALGTVVALTATSSPAVAFAAGTSAKSTSAPHAGATGASGSAVAGSHGTPTTHPSTAPTVRALASSTAQTTTATTTVSSPTTTTTTASSPTTATTTASSPTTTTTAPDPTTTASTTAAPAPTTPTTTTTTTTPTKAVAKPAPSAHFPRTAPARLTATCHTRAGVRRLTMTTAQQPARSVKQGVGLDTQAPASCTQTSPPRRAHKPATRTHPGSGGTSRRPAHDTGGASLAPKSSDGSAAKRSRHTSSARTRSSGGAALAPVTTLSSSAPGIAAPQSWTGTVTADPALTGAVRDLSGLLTNGNRPPSFLIPIYMQAGKRYDIPWAVLAAINAVESDYGRDLNTSTAGAVGWMQFEPATWREYGVAADGHSKPNPYDPRDAIFAAARYLKAAGGSQDISRAVLAYNHANWYVDEVLSRAQAIAHHVQYERARRSKRGTVSVYFATGVKKHPTVRYSGGILSHYDRLIASANMVSAANFPYLYGGGHEQPAHWGPFDCSGAVSYVIQQAGYKVPTTVSGDIPIWKFPAGPGRVTIFYNAGHTFMRIGNRFFGTSGFARPGGGAGWFDVDKLSASYLATFAEVHVPGLGVNSFAPAKVRYTSAIKHAHAKRS